MKQQKWISRVEAEITFNTHDTPELITGNCDVCLSHVVRQHK